MLRQLARPSLQWSCAGAAMLAHLGAGAQPASKARGDIAGCTAAALRVSTSPRARGAHALALRSAPLCKARREVLELAVDFAEVIEGAAQFVVRVGNDECIHLRRKAGGGGAGG